MSDGGVSQLLTVSQRHHGDIVVVAAQGEIDITSAPQLSAALEAVGAEGFAPIVDLSGVDFMGSVGLSVLLAASEQLGGDRLRVVVSAQVRRPLEVTGLDKILDLFDSLDQALAGPGSAV
ncbi:STAS domain-containing protein [Nocardia sp. alder85J]|uniref:STAS domain-containing protein n=1 Tax=Nocardia sp. alder85J TaxID=2862949 RepID=UPI001CD5641C|nr:STAS domain-containing protein [Nocardia sp. alder85J]MCX4095256.1 STAS domain-containing protein [Nocardia sp. alder85J]